MVEVTDRTRNALGQYASDGASRDVDIVIRCTEGERERWKARAAEEDMTLSQLVRWLLLAR